MIIVAVISHQGRRNRGAVQMFPEQMFPKTKQNPLKVAGYSPATFV